MYAATYVFNDETEIPTIYERLVKLIGASSLEGYNGKISSFKHSPISVLCFYLSFFVVTIFALWPDQLWEGIYNKRRGGERETHLSGHK